MRFCYETDNQMLLASPAKLNLFLELHRRREDGFHELETIMTPFGLFDYLYFQKTDDDSLRLRVRTNRRLRHQFVPDDEDNLVIKSLMLMRDLAGCSGGAAIKLFKNIPVQAGMGGASGNAAAAILAANRLWGIHWPKSKLKEIAAHVGSDVAFFLDDSLGRCTGKGEKVQNLWTACRFNIVVVQPQTGMSTAEIYSRCEVPEQPTSSQQLLQSLTTGNLAAIGKALFNRLERFAEAISDDVERLRRQFQRTQCAGHQLTGSGSCYFGLYRNRRSMKAAARILAGRLPEMNIFTGQSLTLRKN